jgi:CheY-like chemotaxis protein
LREIELSRPDAIIVDFRMPGIDGLEFLRPVTISSMRPFPLIYECDGHTSHNATDGVRLVGLQMCDEVCAREDVSRLTARPRV